MSDWKRYFEFSKNEKKAVYFILVVIFVGSLFKLYSEVWSKPKGSGLNLEKIRSEIKVGIIEDSIRLFSDSGIANRDTVLKEFLSININTAGVEELEKLPGIGVGIANGIIEYRQRNGEFKRIEDIKKVKRIGDKKFNEIKNYIKIK